MRHGSFSSEASKEFSTQSFGTEENSFRAIHPKNVETRDNEETSTGISGNRRRSAVGYYKEKVSMNFQ